MFRGGWVEIERSVFTGNEFGIVPNLAVGSITGNHITENKVGILVRDEKDGNVSFAGNNIFNNSRFDLQMGEFNSGNINVTNNWWGEKGPSIFDEAQEPGIGRAVYEPYADKRFKVQGSMFKVD